MQQAPPPPAPKSHFKPHKGYSLAETKFWNPDDEQPPQQRQQQQHVPPTGVVGPAAGATTSSRNNKKKASSRNSSHKQESNDVVLKVTPPDPNDDQKLQLEVMKEGNVNASAQYLALQSRHNGAAKPGIETSSSSASLTAGLTSIDASDVSSNEEGSEDKKCSLSAQSQEEMLARFEQEAEEERQHQFRVWAAQGLSSWIAEGPTRPGTTEAPLPCPVDTLKMLQAEPLDTKVEMVLNSLPRRTIVDLIRMLCNAPDTVQALCEKERGKIVTQVIATLKGEGCECLTDILTNNIRQLATHRVGCVSLTRSFDALMTYKRPLTIGRTGNTVSAARKKDGQQDSIQRMITSAPPTRSVLHFINRVLSVLPDLACHSHGNFVCSAIFGPGSPSEAFEGLLNILKADPSFFLTLAADKWGSHIVDAFAANSSAEHMEKLITFLQANPTLITEMSESTVANYPLQNLLKASVKKLGPDHTYYVDGQPPASVHLLWLLENVPLLTMKSNHFGRISNALGLKGQYQSRQQQLQQQHQPQQVPPPNTVQRQSQTHFQHPPQQQQQQPYQQQMTQQPAFYQQPQHQQMYPVQSMQQQHQFHHNQSHHQQFHHQPAEQPYQHFRPNGTTVTQEQY